jgi:uncharacterized membrane protein YdjX (TVP38/TMEM64 family)
MMLYSRFTRIAFVASAALALGLLAWQGHHLAHWLPQIEEAIVQLGPWGPASYIAAAIALSPLLVPDTIFGVSAGVVFGLGRGFLYYSAAIYAGCLIAYLFSRYWLRNRVLAMLENRSELNGMALAARREGLRLTFWIRLVPINPILVSYALGAVGVPFRAFAIGTLGMLPHMFLAVYFGAVAAHLTQMAGGRHTQWTLETAGFVLGAVACVAVVWQVTSIAWRQVRGAEDESPTRENS